MFDEPRMKTTPLLLLFSLLLTFFASPADSTGLQLVSAIIAAIKAKLLLPLVPLLSAKKKQWLFGNTTNDLSGVLNNSTEDEEPFALDLEIDFDVE